VFNRKLLKYLFVFHVAKSIKRLNQKVVSG